MRYRVSLLFVLSIAMLTALGFRSTGLAASESSVSPAGPRALTIEELTVTDEEYDGNPVRKTETEWKKILTATQYYILRQEGTEKPYTGKLLNNKKKGTYHCAACGLALFSSDAKYDSNTGWPSFFQPIYKKNVLEKADKSLAEERIEIECARCESHIGHVFDDGPQPTGLRYCMNSEALKFKPAK